MRPTLITIPISHYCEKARWALDRAGIDYVEQRHLQILHRPAVKRAGGSGSVPVLALADRTLDESTDIVRWACPDLFEPAEVDPWVARLDAWGVGTRLWIYHAMLPLPGVMLPYNEAGAPAWERALLAATYPAVARMLRRFLRVSDEAAAKAEAKATALLDEVAALLADGRPYFLGEHFTAADLTFACMAAPLVLPPHYGVALPQPEELPGTLARRIEAWRSHPAGAFALRLFRFERPRPSPAR